MSLFFWDFAKVRFSTLFGGSLPRRQRVRIEGYQGVDTGDEIVLSTGSVNVKDFGAVGDWTTDDTEAIQSAISNCVTTGRRLYLQTGRYRVTNTILLQHDIEVYGDGVNKTYIGMSSDSSSPVMQATSTTGSIIRICIRDVTFDGGGVQLLLNPWILHRSSVFRNITFNNFSRKGLQISGTEAVSVQFRNLNFIAGVAAAGQETYGIYASGAAVLHYSSWDSVRVTQCSVGGAGLWIGDTGAAGTGGVAGVVMNNFVFEANSGPAIYIKSTGLIMNNLFLERNGNGAVGIADIQIDTNYSAGTVTYSRLDLYSPSFVDAHPNQALGSGYKRIEYLNHGIELRISGNAFVADSYPFRLQANSYAINSTDLGNIKSNGLVVSTYGQLSMRSRKGHLVGGVVACEGSTPVDTGISVYGGSYGGCAEVLASGHVNPGPTTRSARYWLNYPYDATHGTFTASYENLPGMTDFVTFSLSANGTIMFVPTDGTNASICVIAAKTS